jgi:hypothetical protein
LAASVARCEAHAEGKPKVATVLAILGAISWGGYALWNGHKEQAEEKAEEAQRDARIAEAAAMQANVCKVWETGHPDGSPVDWAGRKENREVVYPPTGCEGPLENSYEAAVTNTLIAVPNNPTHANKSQSKNAPRVLDDTDLATQEYGLLTCGKVQGGESVTPLEDDGNFVKVRTASGQIGWATAHSFEVAR